METHTVNPFVEGLEELVSTMLQSSCSVSDKAPSPPSDVSGLINLIGDSTYQVALSFPRDTAERFVARLLSLDPSEIDDAILGDGIGEMANILVGYAKRKLSTPERPYHISLPSVIVSTGHDLSLFHAPNTINLTLSSELGDFSLRVLPPR